MDWTRLEDPLTGSNCYVLREGTDCLVIDPNRDEVGEWLQFQGLRPSHILLTHEHCDHMAGLEALRSCWPDTPVICTAACSAGLQSTRLNMTCMMEVYLTFQGKPGVHYPPFICRPAEQTFSQPYTFRWQSHTLECIPLPGHTPGSMGIVLDGSTFFSGDYLIPGTPVILRLPGGSEEDYRQYTEPVLTALPVGMKICPGHGSPCFRQKREAEHEH